MAPITRAAPCAKKFYSWEVCQGLSNVDRLPDSANVPQVLGAIIGLPANIILAPGLASEGSQEMANRYSLPTYNGEGALAMYRAFLRIAQQNALNWTFVLLLQVGYQSICSRHSDCHRRQSSSRQLPLSTGTFHSHTALDLWNFRIRSKKSSAHRHPEARPKNPSAVRHQ